MLCIGSQEQRLIDLKKDHGLPQTAVQLCCPEGVVLVRERGTVKCGCIQ